jgi:ethanolamine permease
LSGKGRNDRPRRGSFENPKILAKTEFQKLTVETVRTLLEFNYLSKKSRIQQKKKENQMDHQYTQPPETEITVERENHTGSLYQIELSNMKRDVINDLPPEERGPSDHENQPETKSDHGENPAIQQIASFWDVFAFGICLTSANLSYGAWHYGLLLGFWSFFFATMMIATVFYALHFSIAEMISILPFSGGMYGFARVTVGPFLGFMVGMYESVGNILYTMYGMIQLGYYFCFITNTPRKWVPFFWLLFYTVMLTNEFLGRKYYFKLMRGFAILIILIFLFYIGISIPKTHPHKYFTEFNSVENTFFYGADLTIVSMQYGAFMFFGLEIIPLVSDEVKEAKRDTPRALICTLIFVTVFGAAIMFLTYTQYPGYPYSVLFNRTPLNNGFENMFPDITERVATVFAWLPLLATVSIYMFGFAKQMKALGNSKLLPAAFGWTLAGTKVPYVALLVGSATSFGLLMICYLRVEYYPLSPLPAMLYLSGYMCTYSSFVIVMISFIIFRIKYYNLKREFTSPFGIAGAVYAMLGFLYLLYILFKYTVGDYTYVKIYASLTGISIFYYYFFARNWQTFSEEEQKVMFVVYLMQCKCEFLL